MDELPRRTGTIVAEEEGLMKNKKNVQIEREKMTLRDKDKFTVRECR